MKKIYTLIVIAALCYSTANAQTKKADRLYDRWEYFRAAKRYEKEAVKHNNIDAYYKLGECYYKMEMYKEAQDAYDKVNGAGTYSNPEFYLTYGRVLRNNGNNTQAKAAFEKYNQLVPSDSRGKFYSNSIDVVNVENAFNEPITLSNVTSVNSDKVDFSPVFYKNGMVFASNRKTSGHSKIYGWTGANYLDLYFAEKGSNDSTFTNVKPFSGKNISKKYHDGPACFSKNQDTMYISRVEKYLKGADKKSLMIERNKIFISTLKDDKWTKSVPFEYNSDLYSVAHPFLTSDGSRLYFVSDMPGGFGETDIYYCNRQGDSWGTPINMGPNVNTFNRERYPYVDAKGNFYFASDGHQGYGGLDICVAINNGGSLEKAKPLKFPFNSYTDDSGILFLKDGKTGYFSSNRNGGNSDDIYYFDLDRDNLKKELMTPMYTIGYRPENKIVSRANFAVYSPENIPTERRVRETFPIRNYIFFDLESTEIPNRYVLLTKEEVKTFKEEQLEVFLPKRLTGRSDRQMTAYYNVINILGDRMGKSPSSSITLVGSSEKGPEDAKLMATSVKNYLVNIFNIKASRISIEGQNKPKIPSEQPGDTRELELLRQGDRRVTVESSFPEILMEFQSGPDAPLKPVEILGVQQAPLDSYVNINVNGESEPITSWTLEITDDKNNKKSFGPFTNSEASIPGKSILGSNSQGFYKVAMTGQTKSGTVVKKDTMVQIALWTPTANEEGMRFSVLFEYDDSKSISIYEKYLSEVVTPKIPINGKVIIHGHTDVIGNDVYNVKLSKERANDVRKIMESALSKAGRNDVKFDVFGFGEDENVSPFENELPEQRFYNRTVIIDIVPSKRLK